MRTLLWSYLGQRQFPREMSRFRDAVHQVELQDYARAISRLRARATPGGPQLGSPPHCGAEEASRPIGRTPRGL